MNILGLSFVTPALLGLALVAPVIILAYLNRSPRTEKIVSSLLLLRLLPRAPSIKQKIKIPPLFWLELLVLLLLGFLAAYPNYSSKGDRVAIILDNSLSMRSRQEATTRFELAQNEVKVWVELQSESDRFTLFSSSPRLRRESGGLISKGELKLALTKSRVSSSPDYLDESLSELISSGSYDKIFVASDKEPSYSKGGNTFPVDSRMVGSLVVNAALSNLRFDKKNNLVVSAISLYGSKIINAKVQAYLAGNLIAESPVKLEPKRVIEARLSLPKNITGLVRVEVVLSEPDSIYVDNTGYIIVGGAQTKNILLVSLEDAENNSLGLDKLSAETISPQSYASLSEEAKKEFHLIVLHGVCPLIPPPIPSIFISPPIDCKLFPGVKEVENPKISSWKTESSITSYLDFSLLKPNRSVVFAKSSWAQEVLNAEQGGILLAGEKDGVRYAATGFELLPFEGSSTPTASILTLNLFSWLSSGGNFQDTIRTGAQIQPLLGVSDINNKRWELVLPAGEIIRSDSWIENDGLPRADAPGFYKLRNANGEREFVVNAFQPDESATDERSQYEASYTVTPADIQPRNSDLWRNIIALILLLLSVELVVRLVQVLKSTPKLNRKLPSGTKSYSSSSKNLGVKNA